MRENSCAGRQNGVDVGSLHLEHVELGEVLKMRQREDVEGGVCSEGNGWSSLCREVIY